MSPGLNHGLTLQELSEAISPNPSPTVSNSQRVLIQLRQNVSNLTAVGAKLWLPSFLIKWVTHLSSNKSSLTFNWTKRLRTSRVSIWSMVTWSTLFGTSKSLKPLLWKCLKWWLPSTFLMRSTLISKTPLPNLSATLPFKDSQTTSTLKLLMLELISTLRRPVFAPSRSRLLSTSLITQLMPSAWPMDSLMVPLMCSPLTPFPTCAEIMWPTPRGQ